MSTWWIVAEPHTDFQESGPDEIGEVLLALFLSLNLCRLPLLTARECMQRDFLDQWLCLSHLMRSLSSV